MLSRFEGQCFRCDGVISVGSEVVKRHGHWIHAECASGGGFDEDHGDDR